MKRILATILLLLGFSVARAGSERGAIELVWSGATNPENAFRADLTLEEDHQPLVYFVNPSNKSAAFLSWKRIQGRQIQVAIDRLKEIERAELGRVIAGFRLPGNGAGLDSIPVTIPGVIRVDDTFGPSGEKVDWGESSTADQKKRYLTVEPTIVRRELGRFERWFRDFADRYPPRDEPVPHDPYGYRVYYLPAMVIERYFELLLTKRTPEELGLPGNQL
ncbi:MAG: hypothetical protein V1495_11050 [Pseudomonadota bacterium]